MSDIDDYENEHDDNAVDEEESQAAEQGGLDDEVGISDLDIAEAESLTITAKQHIREQLEDEVARFLAMGGKITQVPAEDVDF